MARAKKITKNSKIAVIAGGISAERDVSLRSGTNMHEALLRLGYKNAYLYEIKADEKKFVANDKTLDTISDLIKYKENHTIDYALLATHGKYGEDGCLQGLLEMIDVPYSGSRVQPSAACMDKLTTKKILAFHGLPILPFWFNELPAIPEDLKQPSLDVRQNPEALKAFEAEQQMVEEYLKSAFIVKPRNEGSSVGVEKFDNFNDFKNDLDFVEKYPNCVIEPFIEGIEVTASVIEITDEKLHAETCKKIEEAGMMDYVMIDGPWISLPLLELRSKNDFYDLEAKYTPGMTEFVLPAEVPQELMMTLHDMAIGAFDAMECSGYARVDFIIPRKENYLEMPYILELNTLPGMTDTSDMPAQAKAAGISYDELVDILVSSIY